MRPDKIAALLESTFIDQTNPQRQTADPLWGSPFETGPKDRSLMEAPWRIVLTVHSDLWQARDWPRVTCTPEGP